MDAMGRSVVRKTVKKSIVWLLVLAYFVINI
jgi:hypothetical protein